MPLPLLAAGAIAGALGGLAGHRKKPPKYDPLPSLYQNYGTFMGAQDPLQYANQDFGSMRGYLNEAIGDQPMWSSQQMNQMLAPGRGFNANAAAAARERAQERAVGLGVAPRSGMLEATMGGIDRSEIGANRATYSDLLNQEARLREARRASAAAQLQNLLVGDQGFRADQYGKQYAAKVARSQAPKLWQSILGGAAGGFLGSLGMGSLGMGSLGMGSLGGQQQGVPYDGGPPTYQDWYSQFMGPPSYDEWLMQQMGPPDLNLWNRNHGIKY